MLGSWIRSIAAVSVIAAPLARAAEPLRLADVLESARRQNPALAAARARLAAARLKPVAAAAYDDPVASWEAWNAPESFHVDRADNNIFRLSQKIPFPGKRSLAGRLAESDRDVASVDAATTELDVVAIARRAYADLWKGDQDLAVYSRDQQHVARLAKIAEQKYALGQVAQPDVLRAQVELTRLVTRVTTERLALDGARAELAAVLGRRPDEMLGTPEAPPILKLDETDDAYAARAMRSRPEMAATAAGVEREASSVAAARLDFLPDFEVSISRFVNYRSRDGFGAMASVSLPFAYVWKYDAEIGRARAGLNAAEAERREVELRIAREVRQAFLRARSAAARRELLVTTHVPLAEQTLRASEIGYQIGKIDFLSLIDSLRAVEAVHPEHVDAEVDLVKAVADLERAVGEPLEGEVR
jgi:outer membrane protein TolC